MLLHFNKRDNWKTGRGGTVYGAIAVCIYISNVNRYENCGSVSVLWFLIFCSIFKLPISLSLSFCLSVALSLFIFHCSLLTAQPVIPSQYISIFACEWMNEWIEWFGRDLLCLDCVAAFCCALSPVCFSVFCGISVVVVFFLQFLTELKRLNGWRPEYFWTQCRSAVLWNGDPLFFQLPDFWVCTTNRDWFAILVLSCNLSFVCAFSFVLVIYPSTKQSPCVVLSFFVN